jgi:DNA-binding transcriptional LysR family regulator
MGYCELIDADLANGTLHQIFPITTPHPYSYYLVYPPERRRDDEVRRFRDWILNEAQVTAPAPVRKTAAPKRRAPTGDGRKRKPAA